MASSSSEKQLYVTGSSELSLTSTTDTRRMQDSAQVVGTTSLYQDGQVRYIPMPTPDPKDPLNLPTWRKNAAIVAVCFCE